MPQRERESVAIGVNSFACVRGGVVLGLALEGLRGLDKTRARIMFRRRQASRQSF